MLEMDKYAHSYFIGSGTISLGARKVIRKVMCKNSGELPECWKHNHLRREHWKVCIFYGVYSLNVPLLQFPQDIIDIDEIDVRKRVRLLVILLRTNIALIPSLMSHLPPYQSRCYGKQACRYIATNAYEAHLSPNTKLCLLLIHQLSNMLL